MLAWLVWAAATGGALVFVLILGTNVPYWDEWELVPFVTGEQQVTPAFLWSLHNEHRIPVPRLVYLGLFALFRDFRAGMVFNVLALSLAAALLIHAARRARGGGFWADGFLALTLLNFGHAENMLWSFQIALVLTTLLVALALGSAVGIRDTPSRSEALGVAGPFMLAPLCGAPGVPLAAVAGAWLLWWSLRVPKGGRTAGEHGSRSVPRWLLTGLGLACWTVVALYMFRYHGNPGHPGAPGVRPALRGVTEFLAVAEGTAGYWYWPGSSALVLVLVGATTVAIGVWWRHSRRDRLTAEGLLAALATLATLALAIGWGRSGFGPGAAAASRYTTLAAPVVLWVYLVWCRLPWPSLARTVQGTCFVAALALYPGNLTAGREWAETQRGALQTLAKEARQGLPVAEIARWHTGDVFLDPVGLRDGLAMLRRRRLGPFSPADDAAHFQRRFPFLKAPLVAARDGIMSIRSQLVGGQPVIVVAANGDLVFDVRPGVRRVSGYFGLLPDFYALEAGPGEVAYDGTFYEATFTPDEGEPIMLFSRLLNPQRNPQDRGLLPFQLSMPDGGGKLTLSTRFGPPEAANANGQHDWGFWADVELR